MAETLLPPAVESLVRALEAGQMPPPPLLAALGRWRVACGDGRGAARWHRWSVQPPEPAQLRNALADLLLQLGWPDLAGRLAEASGWEAVFAALQAGATEQALVRQQALLEAEASLAPALQLKLAALWQDCGQPRAALPLLEAIAAHSPSPALCNAIAHLYEQIGDLVAAAPWWDQSLALAAAQPAVQVQRSRNALTLGDPWRAWPLLQALLATDPGHPQALELQVELMQVLGAPASTRLALAPLLRRRRQRYRAMAHALEGWWRPRRRRQGRWRAALPDPHVKLPAPLLRPVRVRPPEQLRGCQQLALLGSADGAELLGATDLLPPQGVLWNLASPEPLCSQRNLRCVLPPGWQLHTAPAWDPRLHAALERCLVVDPRLWPAQPPSPCWLLAA